MTAVSLQPPNPLHLDQPQNIAPPSRSPSSASAPRHNPNPSPSPRRAHLTMSQIHVQQQQAEASSSRVQVNSHMPSEQPSQLVLRPGRLNLNSRRQSDTAATSSSHRPSSAPGSNHILADSHVNGGASDDEGDSAPLRLQKPPLLRSKSERVLRHEDDSQPDAEFYDWGARHGFEDHYQSEDYISALANVSIQCNVQSSTWPGMSPSNQVSLCQPANADRSKGGF